MPHLKGALMNLLTKLTDSIGCSIDAWTAKKGLAYKLYCALAGSLDCLCCIFWRGLFIGVGIGFIFSILFYLVERFFL